MLRRSAAAAADNIQEPGLGPFADLRRHGRGVEIVFTEGVRQAGVRVSGHVAFGDARQLLYVLAQFVRPQRTVQAKAQGIGVAQGVIKGFGGLPGQGSARGIGDGAGDHDRQIHAEGLELLFHRIDSGFGVEGIEDRFNHDQIGTAFHQRTGRLAVRGHQLVKGDITKCRIVHVRRDRGGAVGRAKHACDVARFLWRAGRPFVGTGTRQFRRLIVDLRRQGFHLVIRHGDSCRVEGVGLNDIRARLEIGVMNGGDNLWLAEHQQVVVTFQIAGPVGEAVAAKVVFTQTIALDHGAHTAIQHQNAFI